jgi:hypothetical protein
LVCGIILEQPTQNKKSKNISDILWKKVIPAHEYQREERGIPGEGTSQPLAGLFNSS